MRDYDGDGISSNPVIADTALPITTFTQTQAEQWLNTNEKINTDPYPLFIRDRQKIFLGFIIINIFITALFILELNNYPAFIQKLYVESYGLPFGALAIFSILVAFITSAWVYPAYIVARRKGSWRVLSAFMLYIVLQLFWIVTLFHSKNNRGLSELVSIIWLIATIWLSIVCLEEYPNVWFLIVIAWNIYLTFYTFLATKRFNDI